MAGSKLSLIPGTAVALATTDLLYLAKDIGGGFFLENKAPVSLLNSTYGSLANPLSQFAATTSAQLAGVISDEVGTGALVFKSYVDGAFAAGVTSFNTRTGAVTFLAADLTSVNGAFTTGTLAQFAATTSAQLLGVISDETGTGLLVFNNSPTFITPVLGAASATSLTLTNPLTVPSGGTGVATFTDGGVLIGNAAGNLQVTTAGAVGEVLTSNGAGVDPTFQASAGASPPFTDTNTLIKGSADATKLLRFEVDGFTTGTTRVLTPPNADITLAGINIAQTFAATQTVSPAVNTQAVIVSGYSLTGANAQSIIDLSGTWNTSGQAIAIKLNITDSSSGAASMLMDLQSSSISQFSVSRLGAVTCVGQITVVLTPTNTRYFNGAGYSLTGASSVNAFEYSGTWNTSGNPTAFKVNITNTASGATTKLMDLQASAVSQFSVSKAGDTVQKGLLTVTQLVVNTGIIASTGYSLTGSSAVNMVDLAGTWNTSGTPTAIKLNITNTGSNAASKLLDLQVGAATQFSVNVAGLVNTKAITMAVASLFTVVAGTNTRAGNAVLVAGTVTVANTTVTANTLVMLTRKTSGGTLGTAITYTLAAGTSFTINSDSALDTSTFSYFLIENV